MPINGAPEWKESTGRLDERVKSTSKRLESLEDDVRSISNRMWAAIAGIIGILAERILSRVDAGAPEMTEFVMRLVLSVS